MTDSVRLAKRVAEAFSCSRREAEQYVEGGWVTVDGVVIEEPGHRIAASQLVMLSPDATLAAVEPVTILLHKPAGMDLVNAVQCITSETLADNDRSGIRFLKKHLADLKSTTPLETQASGLLVFTQDWRVARKLIDGAAMVEQEYIAETSGRIMADGLESLNQGSTKVSWQNETRLRVALKGAHPGQITRMCATVGLKVIGLKRIRIGRMPMAGITEGRWRYLKGYERF